MTATARLYEAHLTVRDLARAIAFYRDRLGLALAREFPERSVAFFWIGPPGYSMLGLWQQDASAPFPSNHTAFAASLAEVLAAPARLRAAGIEPLDFEGKPFPEPVVLAWMPAAAVYFRDSEDNLLEYIAMLDVPPRPELGVVGWSAWAAR